MGDHGYYYLHENGSMIYKRELDGIVADFRESPFVKMFWLLDLENRETAWNLLVEALSLGVDLSRIVELAGKWLCDDKDAQVYVDRIGAKLSMDGNQWCATREDFVDLQESPAGFGDTCLEALAALCKELGYKARKMWGHTFQDLVKA